MTSARFKNVIAQQLARLTGGETRLIARAIDRPKVKGLGSFAIPLPRLLPSNTTLPKKKSKALDTTMPSTPSPLVEEAAAAGSGKAKRLLARDQGNSTAKDDLLSKLQREVTLLTQRDGSESHVG